MAAGSGGSGIPAGGPGGAVSATRAASLTPLDEPRYRLQFVETTEALGESNSVFIIGRKSAIPAAIPMLSGLADGTTHLVETMVEDMSAPSSGSVSREAFIGGRVVVILLPETCSRHNSPAHPVVLRDALRSALGGAADFPAFVLLALPTAELALASASAVARSFPMYSRKTSEGSKALRGAMVRVYCSTADGSIPDLRRIAATCSSIRLTAALVDAPPNELHTDAFVDVARKVAAEVKATKVTVIRGTELRDGGFGGIWNVGKAAEHPPALVILEHCPEGVDPSEECVAMIGKGIVYDSGGLSIKSKTGMPGMKRDCGGACAVLGAFRAIALSGGSAKRICAVLCLAENAVDERSARPDDCYHFYSGKCVEINNTDAEGRLVLADGVAYATKHLNPAVVIDMATLTGAQSIATGRSVGALYTNSEDLEVLCTGAGRDSGDLVHPLPYIPEFWLKEFKSEVADLTNSAADKGNAGSACPAAFIGAHMQSYLDAGGLWAHFDIAAPAHAHKRGTGFGVALLVTICEKLLLS